MCSDLPSEGSMSGVLGGSPSHHLASLPRVGDSHWDWSSLQQALHSTTPPHTHTHSKATKPIAPAFSSVAQLLPEALLVPLKDTSSSSCVVAIHPLLPLFPSPRDLKLPDLHDTQLQPLKWVAGPIFTKDTLKAQARSPGRRG